MTFETILIVLACIIPMYFFMLIMGSCKRLMTFITVPLSIGIFISISAVRNAPDPKELLWLPIVITMLTYMVHQGDGYMDPKIQENLYRIVSAERRWTSVFEEDDDYEITLEPVEIGGFLENTFFSGILFCIFYGIFGLDSTTWVFMPAVYLLAMSIIEVIITLGATFGFFNSFPHLIYWAWRFLAIVLTIVIGISGLNCSCFAKDPNAVYKKLYQEVKDLAVLDYSIDYLVSYNFGDYDYDNPTYFLYDSEANVGATYKDFYGEKNCLYVFGNDDPSSNEVKRYKNVGTDSLVLEYDRTVTATNNPFKFDPRSTLDDKESYFNLTEQKMLNLTQVKRYDDDKFISILYAARNDNSPENTIQVNYQITYNFRTDDNGKPIKLIYFEYNLYTNNSKKTTFTYMPFEGDTGLSDIFKKEDSGSDDVVIVPEPEPLPNIWEIDVHKESESASNSAYSELEESFGSYDFKLTTTYNNNETILIYDSETQVTATYYGNANAEKAIKNNDFITYPPYSYVSNLTKAYYNSNYVLDTQTGYFYPYTRFDSAQTQMIKWLFYTEFQHVETYHISISAKEHVYSKKGINDHMSGYSKGPNIEHIYHLEFKEGKFQVNSVNIKFRYGYNNRTFDRIEYHDASIWIYFNDTFDIPAPNS